jgi:hypothetical protein
MAISIASTICLYFGKEEFGSNEISFITAIINWWQVIKKLVGTSMA